MKWTENNNLVAMDFEFTINKEKYKVVGVDGWITETWKFTKWKVINIEDEKGFIIDKSKLDEKLRDNQEDNNHLIF